MIKYGIKYGYLNVTELMLHLVYGFTKLDKQGKMDLKHILFLFAFILNYWIIQGQG